MSDVSVIIPARITDEIRLKWLVESVQSAAKQGENVEVIVVNDHSTISWQPIAEVFRKDNVRGAALEGISGVAAARNHAASLAKSPLLLPLDADDRLPDGAVAAFLAAWNGGGKLQGIVYSNVLMFGEGVQRVYTPGKYNFDALLKATFMTIGCLHRRTDWERAGGWKPVLEHGFEDWEYWITLGELGVCGHYVDQILYEYRRNDQGRLAALKASKPLWDSTYTKLRSLHVDTYNGRRPEMCCGGRATTVRGAPNEVMAIRSLEESPSTVSIVYNGTRTGSFGMRGVITGFRYKIPKRGTPFRVDSRDVNGFLNYAGGLFVPAG